MVSLSPPNFREIGVFLSGGTNEQSPRGVLKVDAPIAITHRSATVLSVEIGGFDAHSNDALISALVSAISRESIYISVMRLLSYETADISISFTFATIEITLEQRSSGIDSLGIFVEFSISATEPTIICGSDRVLVSL